MLSVDTREDALDMGALNLRKESTGGFIAGKKERVEGGGQVEVATKKGKKKEKKEEKGREDGGGRRRFNQSTKT